jgi:hypothetical protein
MQKKNQKKNQIPFFCTKDKFSNTAFSSFDTVSRMVRSYSRPFLHAISKINQSVEIQETVAFGASS